MKSNRLSILLTLAIAFVSWGCEDAPQAKLPPMSDSHTEDGHDDHPQTFAAGVEALVGMRNKIRDSFESGDDDGAHGPLHEVGHILGAIAGLAENDELDAEQMTAVKDALKTLQESFGAVDEMMHGGEGSDYKDVAEKIDGAVAVLVKASGANPDATSAHKEHGDHEGHQEHGDHEDHKDGDKGHDGEHKDGHKDHDGDHQEGDGDKGHKDHDGHKDGDVEKGHDKDHDKTGDHKEGDTDHKEKAAEKKAE